MIFTIRQNPKAQRYEACGSRDVRPRRQVERRFRSLPIGRHHFRVIKLFNDKLSDLRRSLYHKAENEQTKVVRGSHWPLLKVTENLLAERDEESAWTRALELNKQLAVAYYLKEDLRLFWTQPGKRFAGAFLTDWIRRAEASGVRKLQQMAKTLESRR